MEFQCACCKTQILVHQLFFPQQLNNMDPGDLLSFLDGPGDLATPPSSGSGSQWEGTDVPSFISFILISPEVSPNVFFQQGQALRLESKEVTLLRTISCLSLTEAATSPTSQWPPPPLCEPASHFDGDVTSTFLLYAASHSGPNLGPQIWGHEPLGPYCLIGVLTPF